MPRRTKAMELLDFEIAFYERLANQYPEFIDVLVPLGEAYSRRGLLEKGLAVDIKLTRLREADPIIWYNLACSYSLLNRIDDAVQAMRHAIQLGYDDVGHLRSDPDLANFRRNPVYRELMEQLTQRQAV